MTLVAPDLLFPADPASRAIARDLYAGVKDLPIVSPHGHTEPRWYAENNHFPDIDPDFEGFLENLEGLGGISGCDMGQWRGYLEALVKRAYKL